MKDNVLYETSPFVKTMTILFFTFATNFTFSNCHTPKQFLLGGALAIFLFIFGVSFWKKIEFENDSLVILYILAPFIRSTYPKSTIEELCITYRGSRDRHFRKQANAFFILIRLKNKKEIKVKIIAHAALRKIIFNHFLKVSSDHGIAADCYYK